MSSAFRRVQEPGEQAYAEQIVAATQEISRLAAEAHAATHAKDETAVAAIAHQMFKRIESMSPGLKVNLIASLANLLATIACGDDVAADGGTARVLR